MTIAFLLFIGLLTGATTVLFGFGGGFITVPVLLWVDASAGPSAAVVAVATSALVMVVNAAIATLATPRAILGQLRHSTPLLWLLAAGGLVGACTASFAPEAFVTWGFTFYLAATIVDVIARPGFVRRARIATTTAHVGTAGGRGSFAISSGLGLPIGALAALLGVGGSVMTVPLLRRAGFPMRTAASLANPLTLCIAAPALIAFLAFGRPITSTSGLWMLGAVDLGAAGLLLAGAIPIIVLWRRRPPRVPDSLHAWGYVALLAVMLATMLLRTL